MGIKKQNISDEARKKKRRLQEREIKERLNHITNKILVMSGKGGVGKSSVAGDISLFDNDEFLITREFNKMVDEIVKISEADHDLPAKSTEIELLSMNKGTAG